MFNRLYLEFLAYLSCSYYTMISLFAPMWTMVFSGLNYGRPKIAVIPKNKGVVVRVFRVFRSKRI